MYKILTGRSPHESASGTLQAIEVVTGKRDIQLPSRLNPGLPSDIDYILRKALRNEPQERYASVEAFANDIRAFLDWRPVQARSGDAWYRTRKFARRYWVPLSAVLLLMAGLSVGLFVVNRERAIAQSRFQQVRQLSNRVLALDRVVSGLPGSTKTRTEIVAMSKEYLEGLGAEARSDPDLAVEIGAAYLSLAQVQGVPAGLNLGQYAQAEESLVKAESLIDGVLKTAPQNRKALATSAEISQSRMLLADADNRRDAAVTDGRKAVAQMDALIALGNMSRAEMDIAMRDFSNVSLIFKNAHLYDDSILYARRALEVSPSGTLHEIAASTLSIMADSMRYAGDLEGSLEAIRKAQTMAEGATYRSEAARARAMFGIIWREGEILGQDGQISLGRPDEATVAFQKSLDLMEDVAKADANDTSCRVLIAQAARELGAILSRRDPARALAVYDHGLRRIREFQNNAKARRDEARLLALSSYALRYLNRTGEARQRLDKALQLLRDTKTYPGDRIVLLSDTEIVLRAWGDYLAHSGRLQHALSVYQELLEKVMAAHPEPDADLSNATGISRIYEALATLHLRNGNAAESQSMSVARLNLWQHWARKLPENTYVKQQLEAAGRS